MPATWAKNRPSLAEFEAFGRRIREQAQVTADAAAAFRKAFPEDPRCGEALRLEQRMLETAYRYGASNLRERLEKTTRQLLERGALSPDEQLRLRVAQVQREAAHALARGLQAYHAALERGARDLIREFPEAIEGYNLLLTVARRAEAAHGKALVKELLERPEIPTSIRERARRLERRLQWLGRPFPWKFRRIDGRRLEEKYRRGRLMLIWFWSPRHSLSGLQLPALMSAWERWRDQGLGIVGVCPQGDRAALEQFLERTDLPWPQCLDDPRDPKGLIARLGIQSLPALWLLDRDGVVIDQNAGDGLVDKLPRLLGVASQGGGTPASGTLDSANP